MKDCENLAEDISKQQAIKESYATERISTSRLNTEQSSIKNYGTNRDKSTGKKLDEKALDRNKSKKELTRTKTSSALNTTTNSKKDETKSLAQTKSRGNFNNYNTHHGVDEGSKTVPKTPKADKSESKISTKTMNKTTTSTNLNTPDLKNGKVVSKISAADDKSLKRNPTGKSLNNLNKNTKAPADKSVDKGKFLFITR